MRKLSQIEAWGIIETLCGEDDFFITDYAQKVLNRSPSLASLPHHRAYTILSIGRDLGGEVIRGYAALRLAVSHAGFRCLNSHRELAAYALKHWSELKKTNFEFLVSSAPPAHINFWPTLIYAGMSGADPYLDSCGDEAKFKPTEAVLVLSMD